MQNYKAPDNSLHVLDDDQFEHLLPNGCVKITEADANALCAPTIEQIKFNQWNRIKGERDRRKVGGVKVGTKWFHSDDASRIQQMGLVMMGAAIPGDLQWKTMDGSFVAMTQTLAASIFAASAAGDQALFSKAETHRVAMEASADPATYDYLTGWPKVFGE